MIITPTGGSLLAAPPPAVSPRPDFPFGLLQLPAPHPDCQLIVTIPAKDEAEFIPRTLRALAAQTDRDGHAMDPTSYEVIVLANNCSDATAAVCRGFAAAPANQLRLHVAVRNLPPVDACVGVARRTLMDTALSRFMRIGNPRGMICTTDADTLVDRQWVYWTLAAAARGAQAVGGRILVPDTGRRVTGAYRMEHLLDVTYRSLLYCLESMIDPDPADPWPRHFQHFGPSTAVRADAYRACGGIPPLHSLEDVGLARALERVDISVTHHPNVRVYTSSRVSHRVAGTAFSHQLDEWADLRRRGDSQFVAGLDRCRWLFKYKVALRYAYRQGTPERATDTLARLAREIDVSYGQLCYRIRASATFGALYQGIREQLEGDPGFRDTPIDRAIGELRAFTRSLRHRALPYPTPRSTVPTDG